MSGPANNSDLLSRIVAGAAARRTVRVLDQYGSRIESDWNEIHRTARGIARYLRGFGIGVGEPLAFVGPTSMGAITMLEAAWIAGAIPVLCGRPSTGRNSKQRNAAVRARVAASGASVLIIDGDPSPFSEVKGVRAIELTKVASLGGVAPHVESSSAPATACALLQFTSGSTSDPSLVRVTQPMLMANLDAIAERQDLDPRRDHIISWLPLFHDMGMICMLLQAMTTGTSLFIADPMNFVRAPSSWLEWISLLDGTITAAPDSAYAAAIGATGASRLGTLESLRIAMNGSEPIDSVSFARFVDFATARGAARTVAAPAYGLAEATVGVTHAGITDELCTAPAHAAAPAARGGRKLVLLGRPLSGVEIRIEERPAFASVHPGAGEIIVRGPSVIERYENETGPDRKRVVDGWLRTGDIGFEVDGQLVVCGRETNTLIIGGVNVLAEDLEMTAGRAAGVPAANAVAIPFRAQGRRERVALLLEAPRDDLARSASAIRSSVLAEHGVALARIWAMERGAIPRTTSGKPRRRHCMALVASLDGSSSY